MKSVLSFTVLSLASIAVSLGASPLHDAAKEGDIEVIRTQLVAGVDVNSRDSQGDQPLLIAARQGHEAIVRLLLNRGARVDASGAYKITPLFEAVDRGHSAVALVLLEAGADPQFTDRLVEGSPANLDHEPMLVRAAENCTASVVRRMLSTAVPQSVKNKALGNAYVRGNVEVLEFLLSRGVAADDDWLCQAVERGQDEIVTILLKHSEESRSDLSERLFLSCYGTTEGHTKVTELLLAYGADLHVKQMIIGSTPLHIAASRGAIESARILLAHGARVNVQADDKQTPLHDAAKGGHADVVRLLLESGADVHAVGSDKKTALVQALQALNSDNCNAAVIEILLEHGARINESDEDGWYPLHYAADNHFCKAKPLQLLLEHGAEIDSLTSKGETALCLLIERISAEENSDWEEVRLLLLWGAELNNGVQQGLRDSSDAAWRAILREEYEKVAVSAEEHCQFMRRVDQDTNTSYAFEVLRIVRDRHMDVIKAYGEQLQSQEGLPKVLVRLVQDFALTKPQKRRWRELGG